MKSSVQYLSPAWFGMVMGLSGFALLWQRASDTLGAPALLIARVLGCCAAMTFMLLAIASLVRWYGYRDAIVGDSRHPMRRVFFAAIPVSVILLSTVWVVLVGTGPIVTTIWMTGCVLQLFATLWVIAPWFGSPTGLVWPAVTPALFIPVVGNVIVVIAGAPLGLSEWSIAQCAIGIFFWPIITALMLVRITLVGFWPDRLAAVTFICVAPPALLGLIALQLGLPILLGWAAFGVACFMLTWSLVVLPRLLKQEFSMAFWALSFPLAAFTTLSLRLAGNLVPGHLTTSLFLTFSLLLLVLTSVVILILIFATLRGLFRGNLLVEEPAALPNAVGTPVQP